MGEPMNIAVIGGGAAGISAASMAKRTNPDATVVICTEYEDVAYSPCGIPYVLGREIPDFERLFLAGPENYAEAGIDDSKDTIAYCRIGERSSHTWFVLKELLGRQNVKNYDGSWTEYGSLIGVPIALGDEPGKA